PSCTRRADCDASDDSIAAWFQQMVEANQPPFSHQLERVQDFRRRDVVEVAFLILRPPPPYRWVVARVRVDKRIGNHIRVLSRRLRAGGRRTQGQHDYDKNNGSNDVGHFRLLEKLSAV